jgi:hypothetical protein
MVKGRRQDEDNTRGEEDNTREEDNTECWLI